VLTGRNEKIADDVALVVEIAFEEGFRKVQTVSTLVISS
jgi:hypothetical protein